MAKYPYNKEIFLQVETLCLTSIRFQGIINDRSFNK